MASIIKRLLFVLLFATPACTGVLAETINATSCNNADVQNAINKAAKGDVVLIPAGTCTWTSGVTISGKGIHIVGAGAGRIIAYSSTTLSIGTGSKTLSITGTGVAGTPPSPVDPSITSSETLTISELGNRQNYMVGTVTSYTAGTLVMNISSTGGTCGVGSSSMSPSNCARWIVSTIPSTVIIHNSNSALFTVTEDSTLNTTLSGFKIAHGTGTGLGIQFRPGGGKPIILHDLWIEQNNNLGSIHTAVNRGLVYNSSFDSTPFSMSYLAFHLQPKDETAWANPSYFGANDTNGDKNFYAENCDFHAYLNAIDNDDGARSVWRYSLFNNAGLGAHGADTSILGQRYFEFYNNVGVFNGYNTGKTFDMNWWFFMRGGTYVIHDNVLPQITSTDYPHGSDINMTVMNLRRSGGPNPCWGAGTSQSEYPAPHQVGLGYVTGTGVDGYGNHTYNASSWGFLPNEYVGDSEPAYAWNNSRTVGGAPVALSQIGISDYALGQSNSCTNPILDTSTNYIISGRDYFNTASTAKPGYTSYTYPHPLELSSGPIAPRNLRVVPQ